MGLKIDKLSELLELGRVYVPPHKRVRDGKVQNVDGYWRHTPDHYNVGGDDGGTDIPSTVAEATKVMTDFQKSSIKQAHDDTVKIFDSLGKHAAASFDPGMTGVVAFERGDTQTAKFMPGDSSDKERVSQLLKGDVFQYQSLQKFVRHIAETFQIDESNPKLRKDIAKAWDRTRSLPVMQKMMERYGTVPVYVGPGFAHPEMGPDIAANAAAENLDEVGIIYYDHTKDKHQKKMISIDKDVPKPGANVLSSSEDSVLRHEYGHTILTAEERYETEWFQRFYRAWVDYKYQNQREGRFISEYSFASYQEGFAEAFSLLTNPNWRYEMMEGYNGQSKRVLMLVQELIDMEPRNLVDDFIRRQKEGDS